MGRRLTFAELAVAVGVEPAAGKGFGSGTLRHGGKIFAMESGGHLVFKLPAARVAALIAAGDGLPLDAGKGQAMKEWVALSPTSKIDPVALARGGLAFVAGR
jgi:hypothetical protein